MFKRCLKYDLKSFRTVFLIASVAVLLICSVCGLTFGAFTIVTERNTYVLMNAIETTPLEDIISAIIFFIAFLSIYALAFGISIYSGLIGVLRLVRYFTHFFTDQGYLTFTLPVPRKTLFRSKIVSHMLYSLWAYGVLLLGGGIMLSEIAVICLFSPYTRMIPFEALKSLLFTPYLGFFLVLALLLLALFVASIIASIYLDYFIVTFAATMFRRLKVLSVIVTYYVISNVLMVPVIYICTYAMLIPIVFATLGFTVLFYVPWLGFLGIYLLLLIAIVAMIVFSIIFKNLTLRRLERKVNLA